MNMAGESFVDGRTISEREEFTLVRRYEKK